MLERHETVVLLQKTEQPLVLGGSQVEQLGEQTIAAMGMRQTHADDAPHGLPGQVVPHEGLVDDFGKRFAVLGHAFVTGGRHQVRR